jgi:hypothetical protein
MAFLRCIPWNFLLLGLHSQKLGFTIRHHRSRWLCNKPNRPVFGEFRRVRPKQYFRSLTNRSGDTIVPPQLPSGRSFIFQSCRLPAASTRRVSRPKILLRLAEQSASTSGQGMKTASAPTYRWTIKPTTGEKL